jgi:hypothetical protein
MSEVAIIESRRSRRNHNRLDGRTTKAKLARQWDQRWHVVFNKILSEIPTDASGSGATSMPIKSVERRWLPHVCEADPAFSVEPLLQSHR